jgi:hypothetical protein
MYMTLIQIPLPFMEKLSSFSVVGSDLINFSEVFKWNQVSP